MSDLEKMTILPNGQWKLEKMSKLLKPKRSQNFLIPKNMNVNVVDTPNQQYINAKTAIQREKNAGRTDNAKRMQDQLDWDAEQYNEGTTNRPTSNTAAGTYDTSNDATTRFQNTIRENALSGLPSDMFDEVANSKMGFPGKEQNIDHHEHQHRILSHMANKMNMTIDGKPVENNTTRKANMLANHIVASAGLNDDEVNALKRGATGINLKEDTPEFHNELIANMIGWLNMGDQARQKHLQDNYPTFDENERFLTDEHIRSAHKKMQNAIEQIEPHHSLHMKGDIIHHEK